MIYYLVPETLTNPAVQSQAVSIALALRAGLATPLSYWGFVKEDPGLQVQAERIKSELAGGGVETRFFVLRREKGVFAVLRLLGTIAWRLRARLKEQPGPVLVRNLFGAQLAYFATLGVKDASYIIDLRGHTGAEWEMTGVLRPGSLKARAFYRWEGFLLRHAASVLCVSSVLAEYVRKVTGQKTPCQVIPSCLDKLLEKELAAPAPGDEGRGDDRVVLAYAGTITGWNRVETMAAFFERVSRLFPVHFLCITTDVEKARASLALAKPVGGATFEVVRVPHEEIISTLRRADVGLLLRDQSMVNRVASPVKAAEYMTAGLAVVVSDGIGDLSAWVRERRLGLVLASLDPAAWTDEQLVEFFQDIRSNRGAWRVRVMNFARDCFVRKQYLPRYREALGLGD